MFFECIKPWDAAFIGIVKYTDVYLNMSHIKWLKRRRDTMLKQEIFEKCGISEVVVAIEFCSLMVTLNFSFTEIPTSFYEKSDQLIGFCVLELV